MVKYIKWVIRLIIRICLLVLFLPIYTILYWAENKITIINAFKTVYRSVREDWWGLDIDE